MSTSRSIFVNLVVSDLPRTRAFFEQLGMTFNPQFSNDEAACMVVSELGYFMLHTPPSMARFTALPPGDPRTTMTGIYAFSVNSREEVDQIGDRALAAGAGTFNPPMDHGFMYLRSFRDPDGHAWEVFWMNPEHVQA